MEISSTPVEGRTDRVHRFAGRALAVLDSIETAPAWAMTPAEQAETLTELARVRARLTELEWRVLAAADRNEIGAKDGSTGTAAWLARRTRENRTRANGELRGAMALDRAVFDPTRAAFAAGALTEDQVWVIIRAIEDLPADEVTDDQRRVAQDHLIGLAREHDAKTLRLLARRLFEVLAPDEADKREAEALEREERRALQKTRFAMRDNGDGTHSGSFKIPSLQAGMLLKALQAFAAPRRNDPSAWVDADGRKVPYATQLGHAFCDLVEHLPVDKLPRAGGKAASVVITMALDQLRRGVGAAGLDTGGTISPGEARRMACNAGIVPAVLGGRSEVLDLGRTARLASRAQVTAADLRDRGCVAESCDRPPAWTEKHHLVPWSEGGETNIDDLASLCPFHHRLAHDDRYDMHRMTNGQMRFHRRT